MKKFFFLFVSLCVLLLPACGLLTRTNSSAEVTMPASWSDRSIFRSGLVASQRAILGQLPGATVYHIDVTLDPGYTSLHGQEQVQYTNRETVSLNEIYFQLFPNMQGGKTEITHLKVDGNVLTPAYSADNTALKVSLPAALVAGKSTMIEMDFSVTVPTETGGNYGLFAYQSDLLALDGFYPSIPVYDEKGWHEGQIPANADTTFQDASFYLVKVTAPLAIHLVASGNQVKAGQKADQQTVLFAAGPARDFYLAGSEKYVEQSRTLGETKVAVYALAGQKEGATLALDTAVRALGDYSKRLGAYPYTEFDVVSIPMQAAFGIEYPGITGINHTLFDEGEAADGTPRAILLESTVAHETGHQWFYNLVGNDQANEPWLDEAVTQYITGLYYLDEYYSSGWQGIQNSWLDRWQRVDEEEKPIGLPAADYTGKEYGAIVYGRGPLFVEALAKQMGQKTFDEFLQDYVSKNTWGIATAADFKSLAEQHCACDLSQIFNQWVTEK